MDVCTSHAASPAKKAIWQEVTFALRNWVNKCAIFRSGASPRKKGAGIVYHDVSDSSRPVRMPERMTDPLYFDSFTFSCGIIFFWLRERPSRRYLGVHAGDPPVILSAPVVAGKAASVATSLCTVVTDRIEIPRARGLEPPAHHLPSQGRFRSPRASTDGEIRDH